MSVSSLQAELAISLRRRLRSGATAEEGPLVLKEDDPESDIADDDEGPSWPSAAIQMLGMSIWVVDAASPESTPPPGAEREEQGK
ncbi:MAG TPA: hypothetical protein VME43_30055 [Bryobacteraceae bacterium]|nr:hypothetical protein [Bryobacteraceae bacterium]